MQASTSPPTRRGPRQHPRPWRPRRRRPRLRRPCPSRCPRPLRILPPDAMLAASVAARGHMDEPAEPTPTDDSEARSLREVTERFLLAGLGLLSATKEHAQDALGAGGE